MCGAATTRNAEPPRPAREAGFSLPGLLAGVTIMLGLMAVGVPSWRYVMKNAREEELIHRGIQIAAAIKRYQDKNGGALPPSLEVLVKGKYLRKLFKDPMTADGKWRFIRPGEGMAPRPQGVPGLSPLGASPAPSASPSPGVSPRPSSSPGQPGGALGPGAGLGSGIQGVASTSTEKSLRVLNGRTRYDEWLFVPNQQWIIGRPMALPGQGTPASPGFGQSPRPSPTPRRM